MVVLSPRLPQSNLKITGILVSYAKAERSSMIRMIYAPTVLGLTWSVSLLPYPTKDLGSASCRLVLSGHSVPLSAADFMAQVTIVALSLVTLYCLRRQYLGLSRYYLWCRLLEQ